MIWETHEDDSLFFQKETEEFLISEFQPQGADKIWTNGYFLWKLSTINPAGNGYLTIGSCRDKIIASVSLMKKRLLINGKEYTCAEFGDAYCSDYFFKNMNLFKPEKQMEYNNSYLDKSVFGRIAYLTTKRAIEQDVDILYAVPNHQALPSWVKRLGHFNFEDHMIYSMARPMFTYFSKKYHSLRIFKPLLKFIDNLILCLIHFFTTIKDKNKLDIDESIPNKRDFDYLWEFSKPKIGITLVRDYEYWNHRYILKPNSNYKTFTLKHKGSICAIVVICIQKSDKKIYRLSIIEWIILPGYSLYNVLGKVIHILRKKEFDIIVTYGNLNEIEAKDFRKLFFIKRNKINITFFQTKTITPDYLKMFPLYFYMGNTDAI